jgi:hypothetical protein
MSVSAGGSSTCPVSLPAGPRPPPVLPDAAYRVITCDRRGLGTSGRLRLRRRLRRKIEYVFDLIERSF